MSTVQLVLINCLEQYSGVMSCHLLSKPKFFLSTVGVYSPTGSNQLMFDLLNSALHSPGSFYQKFGLVKFVVFLPWTKDENKSRFWACRNWTATLAPDQLVCSDMKCMVLTQIRNGITSWMMSAKYFNNNSWWGNYATNRWFIAVERHLLSTDTHYISKLGTGWIPRVH